MSDDSYCIYGTRTGLSNLTAPESFLSVFAFANKLKLFKKHI